MGCSPSKILGQSHHQQHTALVIGAPQDVQIQIPRNRVDEQGVPLQHITRDVDNITLLAALDDVSEYIAGQSQHISAIVVGGAVSTLHLRSRVMAHDVDIFGSDISNDERILLDTAMHDAQQRYSGLGTDWINTETQLYMSGPLHQELTMGARQQNVRIYDGPGLTIYAAPWQYAFSAKIDRILKGSNQTRPHDLEDAIAYIHEYIRAHGNEPVPVAAALNWALHYHHKTNNHLLRSRVNGEYQRAYDSNAFV